MSEEEKKAIQELTEIKELVEEDLKYDDYEVTATLDQIDLKSLVIVLNLIEKQQKELGKEKERNEELEMRLLEKDLYIDGLKEDRRIAIEEIQEEYYISKDKIKEDRRIRRNNRKLNY